MEASVLLEPDILCLLVANKRKNEPGRDERTRKPRRKKMLTSYMMFKNTVSNFLILLKGRLFFWQQLPGTCSST